MVGQVVSGTRAGADDASAWHAEQLVIADLTVNIATAPDSLVQTYLGNYPPQYVRSLAAFAKSERLSLFDTSLFVQDQRLGITPSLLTRVLVPVDGARLSGTAVLDAYTASDTNVTVQFRVSGGSLHDALVGVGRQTIDGWIARWDTRTVANGGYLLQSVLVRAGHARSPQSSHHCRGA